MRARDDRRANPGQGRRGARAGARASTPSRKGQRYYPRASSGPVCRHCGQPIVGVAETKYGKGWVHQRTNRERCAEGGELAEA